MAFIVYLPDDQIPPEHQMSDSDHILRVHSVHSGIMKLHYDLYVELMHRVSPLSRVQREMIAVAVSHANGCHY